ncbi:MAG: class I SAM-dependent methyltransferase [Bryobacteraceae bacterium]|jgi:SAM-dependent methyltransferase
MNLAHRWLCFSPRWKQAVAVRMPWVLEGVDLGANVLEVGPGDGATTDLLRGMVAHLTCVELDGSLAEGLRRRALGGNVTILHEDATAMSLPDAAFDGALCFAILHHVPSAALQDRLLAEVARVLRAGGIFAGADSRYSLPFRLLHLFDTMVVVDPETFPDRLKAVGFEDVHVDLNPGAFRFRARRAA